MKAVMIITLSGNISRQLGGKTVKSEKVEPENCEKGAISENPADALRKSLKIWESIYSDEEGNQGNNPPKTGKVFFAGVIVGFFCSRLLTEEGCLLALIG